MLIDTHCHLDAAEFDADRQAAIARAGAAGVGAIVIPAVARSNFRTVCELAHGFAGGAYALGIHPLFVPDAADEDLVHLAEAIEQALDDPRFVAIGEIGLDFFVPRLCTPAMRERQAHFYQAQLALAQRHDLPVLLHVRRAQDDILKGLRRHRPVTGIAHAFNGSFQQAEQFLAMGFALGFGGAMTFERARQIRRLAAKLPEEALVLETDAPDIPPAWLGGPSSGPEAPRNEPAELAGISQVLAQLRGLAPQDAAALCSGNACRVLPRLGWLLKDPVPTQG